MTDPVPINIEHADEIRSPCIVPHEAGDSGHVLVPPVVVRRFRSEELDDGCGQCLRANGWMGMRREWDDGAAYSRSTSFPKG